MNTGSGFIGVPFRSVTNPPVRKENSADLRRPRSSDDRLEDIELQAMATRLGVRMIRLHRRDPEACRTLLQAQDNRGTAGVCGLAVRKEADSVGASGAAAAREEKGTQAYEAQQPSVFTQLGAAQGDGSVGSSPRATAWSPEGGIWPCYFAVAQKCWGLRMLGEDNLPIRTCPMLEQHKCLRPHDREACQAAWTNDADFQR